MSLLEIGHFQNGINGFCLGTFNKSACIDDDGICLFIACRNLLMRKLQHAQQILCIHQILGTAK